MTSAIAARVSSSAAQSGPASSVPARAKRGEVVTVSFHARPGSTCQLTLAGAKQAQQPVLAPAVVDPTGQVSLVNCFAAA